MKGLPMKHALGRPVYAYRLWRAERRVARWLAEPCPLGGLHDWDIGVHGPGGTVFGCVKCEKAVP